MDATILIATHEAAHATACFVLGHPVETLQAWSTDGKTRHPTPKTEEGQVDGFALAQIALSGEAFTEALGLSKFGSNEVDKMNAAKAILLSSPKDAPLANVHAGLEVLEQATKGLVSSERFTNLALDLSSELAAKHFMIGSEIERFLGERDPHAKALEEAHDAVRPKESGAYLCRASDWSPLSFSLPGTPGRGRLEVAAYF